MVPENSERLRKQKAPKRLISQGLLNFVELLRNGVWWRFKHPQPKRRQVLVAPTF